MCVAMCLCDLCTGVVSVVVCSQGLLGVDREHARRAVICWGGWWRWFTAYTGVPGNQGSLAALLKGTHQKPITQSFLKSKEKEIYMYIVFFE